MKKNQIMITALAIMIAIAGYLNFAGNKISEESSVVLDDKDDDDITALLDVTDDMSDIESLDSEAKLTDDYMEEDSMTDTPGEAVFTSTQAVSSLSEVKLLKEQSRAKNKETLLDIINSTTLEESQKQDAINGMIELTDIAEKETAAQILLEAKGFTGAVVSISDGSVDVVVGFPTLTDVQLAQIEDIVVRKTGIAPENIVISPLSGN